MTSLKTYNHSSLWVDGVLQFLKVYSPLGRRGSPGCPILGRMERDISNGAARHLDIAYISVIMSVQSYQRSRCILLIEERLEDDDFVAGFNEPHKGTQHALHRQHVFQVKMIGHPTFIRACGNGYLGIRVDIFAEERRVSVRNSLLEARTAL